MEKVAFPLQMKRNSRRMWPREPRKHLATKKIKLTQAYQIIMLRILAFHLLVSLSIIIALNKLKNDRQWRERKLRTATSRLRPGRKYKIWDYSIKKNPTIYFCFLRQSGDLRMSIDGFLLFPALHSLYGSDWHGEELKRNKSKTV